ncbi:hypothetical protein FHG87_012425 [Trinorchestia longiramus]|nr:hypothetical protein FHG87_012425 [Trinorchestia longiramus]
MGKKGKSMGDKLARMTVEQRKQYLEKKAAQEEENLRRREELVGAFLKKKLTDEQRMGRINEAKLNTKWRAILRKTKCTSLKIQLESLVLGMESASAAQDRLTSVLRAQLQQTHLHRNAALHAHAHTTNLLTGECSAHTTNLLTGECSAHTTNLLTGECSAHATNLLTGECSAHATNLFTGECSAHTTNLLTGEHEQQLQSLTAYMRQQQEAILSASAHHLQSLSSHFLHQMYHLHIVLLAVKDQHQVRQQDQSEFHLEHMDLVAARQEDETSMRVAAKKAEVEKVQEQVVFLQQEHVQDVGVLQEECQIMQVKLDDVTKSLRAAQNTVNKMKAEISAPPEAGASSEGFSIAKEELERLQKQAALLQAAAAAAEARNEAAIRTANARADAATKRLESVLAMGRHVLKTWSLCCKLQTDEDKLLPFLPPDPRIEVYKRENDLKTHTLQTLKLKNKVYAPEVTFGAQGNDLHPKDGLSDRKASSKSGLPAPSDSGLGTSLVGSSEADSFRPATGNLPAVVESPAVSRLLADESAARSAAAADDIHHGGSADQHDYTIAQAEDILRSHESIVRVTRQLQFTKIQRSNLHAKEKQLRRQVQQLTQTLRTRIHSLGASDVALAAASNPPIQATRLLIKPEIHTTN